MPWRLGALLLLLGGCEFDMKDLEEVIDACDGMTLSEVASADDLSGECRDAINSFLPEFGTSFEDRLVVLGIDEKDGATTVYVHGVKGTGTVLSASDVADATVTAIGADGAETDLVPTAVKKLAAEYGDVLSVSLVTDYSGSMREEDLDLIAELHTDLLTELPVVYEAEVAVFSAVRTEKQDFTENAAALKTAVLRDETIERESTALYDAMGTGIDHLASRVRPGRLLVVATDGQENASTVWARDELLEEIVRERIVLVMIGALFSDLDEMRALTEGRGIFFYAADFAEARDRIETWIDSLGRSSAIHLDALPAGTERLRIRVSGVSTTVEI